MVATNAYTDALRTMWYYYLAIGVLGICASLAITKNQLSKEHEVQKQGLEEQERQRKEDKRLSRMSAKRKSGDMEHGVKDSETAAEKVDA